MNPRFGCRAERGALAHYLEGRADATSRIAFERHADSCDDCRRALDFEAAMEEALHRDVGPEFDAGYEARILAGVRSALEVSPPRAPARSAVRLVGVAAAAAAGIVLFVALRSRPTGDEAGPRAVAPPDLVSSHGAALESSPRPALGIPVGDAEAIDATRLAAARGTIRDVLRRAAASADFPSTFDAGVAALVAERWPIDVLVRSAIDDADPAVASAALRAVVERRIPSSVPAVRRAARRDAVAEAALITLGSLGDVGSLATFERALADPRRALASIEGLRRLGGGEAARLLARRLSDEASGAAAVTALAALGPDGMSELLRAAERGDRFVATELAARALPTLADLEAVLRSSLDAEVIGAAARRMARFGDVALPSLFALAAADEHRTVAFDAIVAIGSSSAIDGVLVAAVRKTLPEGAAFELLGRLFERALDPRAQALRLARGVNAGQFIALVSVREGDPRGVDWLRTIAAASDIALPLRVASAYALADRDLLDPTLALAVATDAALAGESRLATRALLAAARSGASLHSVESKVDRVEFSEVCSRVERVAERWRREDSPPPEDDERILARRLEDALP